MNLKNQIALITGGSRGIGYAVAEALGKEGVKLVLAARTEKQLKDAGAKLKDSGCDVLCVPTDVSDNAQVEALVAKTLDAHRRIDILFNNAGIFSGGPIGATSPEDWKKTIDINLNGMFYVAHAVWRPMKKQGGGWIFNLASYVGKNAFANISSYGASKFGVVGLSHIMSDEGKPHNIRVTALCPGYVATPMTTDVGVAPEDMIQPEDMAETVLYLLKLSPKVVVKDIVFERLAT